MTEAPASLLDHTGRVVLVTGAGGGIGAGVAQRFSEAGASIVVHTGSRDPAAATARLSGPTTTVVADLTDADGPERVVAAAVSAFGRLDAVVNNAGIQPLARLADVPPPAWQRMIDVNLTAVHRVTQAAAAHMTAHGGGSVVHIASIEARQPAPDHGPYAVAKAGVVMHARAAAAELGGAGIRVNVVSPGLIDRPGLADEWPDGVSRWTASAPLGRLGTPEDVGDACLFLCSPLARWITGAELVVDGGVLCRPTW